MRSPRAWLHCLVVICALTGGHAALAVQPDEILPDPALEARARNLSKELRCMVCQNQSIDDSDAPLARELRILVRDRLKAGDSDRQVLDFLTARYGDFVLLKPRFGWDTAALWLAPAAVLLIGAGGLVVMLRRRRRASDGGGGNAELTEPQLSAAERTRLTELLGQSEHSTGQPS
jgi:cytochrome c-type biogenesis protein CcmH